MRCDTTRQIPHSKLPRPIYDILTQSSDVLCRQTQPVVLLRVRFRHGSLFRHQASGCVNSSSARALCGIGIAAYVATFLVGIFHLPLSRLYLASWEKASPTQTWPAGRLRSRELEDTCTNADGWHEWKWFQIGDVVFGFPTRSIAHHEMHLLNAE